MFYKSEVNSLCELIINVYPILSEMKQMSMNDLQELLPNHPVIHVAGIHLVAE